MALTSRRDGLTVFGSDRVRSAIAVNTKASTASGIVLVQPDGTEKYIFLDDTGDLKIGTRANFEDPNNAGDVIGGQS